MPRSFIIDTDTASDDAVALLMALRHPDVRVEHEQSVHALEGITCRDCHGGNSEATSIETAHRGDFEADVAAADDDEPAS